MVCAGRATIASSPTTPPAANPPPSVSSTRGEHVHMGNAAGKDRSDSHLLHTPEQHVLLQWPHRSVVLPALSLRIQVFLCV